MPQLRKYRKRAGSGKSGKYVRTAKYARTSKATSRGSTASRGSQGTTGTIFRPMAGYNTGAHLVQWIQLEYADLFTLTSGNAGLTSATEQQFRLNSVFDPDLTNVGHQPNHFDQWAAMYNKYCVTGCSFQITLYDGSEDNMLFVFAVSPPNDATGISSALPMTLYERQNAEVHGPLKNGTSGQNWQIAQSVNFPRVTGLTSRQMLQEDNYQALISANPTNQIILRTACASGVGSDTKTLKMQIKLKYTVKFWERTVVAAS